ncbi:Bro-N domain-containing protein [Pseudomonas sp. 21LCFQ010]|uniref:BRO-N domain-containing protein n=1 Tax=Pseudomonas sp. 21LCFQ010 TaxID=2957506 RepID=UPI002097AA42|nr:Bro-N domain-containing protein [Pseudomonas sp. 21LCFQ010]MCO8162973.1 Bro-N domain-containing protein [Pseudomonas sp. 21LCFQ010]
MQNDLSPLTPTIFHRYGRQLRVTLLENQVWFCARDLGRLIAWPLNARSTCKLDPDQRRTLWLESHGRCEEELMISESGVYVLLVHHHHPEQRSLRQWITNEVVAAVRDAQPSASDQAPMLSLLQWPGLSMSMLHWQNEPWIRLRDVPQVLPVPEAEALKAGESWWRACIGR